MYLESSQKFGSSVNPSAGSLSQLRISQLSSTFSEMPDCISNTLPQFGISCQSQNFQIIS
jgi:hypothetical protein